MNDREAVPKRASSGSIAASSVARAVDLHALLAKAQPSARATLEAAMLPLLARFGTASRSFIRGVLQSSR